MVYKVFFTKEVFVDADTWEEAVQKAEDEDFIMCDEYLDDERNGMANIYNDQEGE